MLCRRLAAFAGGWHIDRAERICAAEYLLRDIRQLLGTLSQQEAYLMPGFASTTDPERAYS